MFETDLDTFGICLPVKTWQRLFALAIRADRTPSDYLRILIQREAEETKPDLAPALRQPAEAVR